MKECSCRHSSTERDADPLVTSVHESTELLSWQTVLKQLDVDVKFWKMDSFHCKELSDHFQPKLSEELTFLPPTQQPLLVLLHSCCVRFTSLIDTRAAKCPLSFLQEASESFHERRVAKKRKHFPLLGPTTQSLGHVPFRGSSFAGAPPAPLSVSLGT